MDSTITAVTVYPDRARITRRGEVTLKEGVHQVEISNISVQMDPESLRATARGSARARLLGLQVQKKYLTETPADYVHDLETQYESTQDEMKRLEAQKTLVEDQKARLRDLAGHTGIYARSLAKREIDVESQLAMFDGLRARSERLEAELQIITQNMRELERRLQKLNKQLDQLHNARPRECYSAIIEVEILQPGTLEIDLVYVVSSAGWKPLYDMRLVQETETPKLEIGFMAQVTQRTGENWDGVSLTLSTARPAISGVIPELDPWFIAPRLKPMPKSDPSRLAEIPAAIQPAAMRSEPAMQMDAEIFEAEQVTAEVKQSTTAVSYQVPGNVVVPTDGEPHKVTVARFSLSPELDYVTTPKMVQAAYRRAKVKNDSPYALLPGSANLFAGDEFIGTTSLELVAPQGKIELYLGVDDRIRVLRELKRRDVDKALIGGKRRLHYAYEIQLSNHSSQEVRITLQDQIPVGRHEEIKVKLTSVDPKPSQQNEMNILEWVMAIPPGGNTLVRFDYDVEHPQEMQVVGLP